MILLIYQKALGFVVLSQFCFLPLLKLLLHARIDSLAFRQKSISRQLLVWPGLDLSIELNFDVCLPGHPLRSYYESPLRVRNYRVFYGLSANSNIASQIRRINISVLSCSRLQSCFVLTHYQPHNYNKRKHRSGCQLVVRSKGRD